MKVAKVKLMSSQKIYWLTERQADVVEKMTQSGQYAGKLVPMGGDKIKLSMIKSIEFEEEDFAIAPQYFKDAVKKEMNGALPEPEEKHIETKTKTYYADGTETTKTFIVLCKEGVPFIEKDYRVLSKKHVVNQQTGRDEIAYQLGEVVEERYIGFQRYEGYYAPTVKSVKKNGVEMLNV